MMKAEFAPPDSRYASELEKLEKQHKKARFRYALLLYIPVLWILGIAAAYALDNPVLWEGIAIYLVGVVFLIGAWVFAIIPSRESLEKKYARIVLPALFEQRGIKASYFNSHLLSITAFLKSGLYQENYSTLLREDSLTGDAQGMPFGMYQVAVQVASGVGGGSVTRPRSRILTNHFYGWVIQCGITAKPGQHTLVFRDRKTAHESDDWILPVREYWFKQMSPVSLHAPANSFEDFFLLFTDQPKAAAEIFNPAFQKLLVYLAQTSVNAFALTISGNLFTLHIGHDDPTFRSCPEKNFDASYHPQMLLDVQWYSDLLKGIKQCFR
jgi:hypothetical protein